MHTRTPSARGPVIIGGDRKALRLIIHRLRFYRYKLRIRVHSAGSAPTVKVGTQTNSRPASYSVLFFYFYFFFFKSILQYRLRGRVSLCGAPRGYRTVLDARRLRLFFSVFFSSIRFFFFLSPPDSVYTIAHTRALYKRIIRLRC